MGPNDWIQCGLLAIGTLTLLFYVIQYRNNNKENELDNELKNLSQAFAAEELTNPLYKNKVIRYPETLVLSHKSSSDKQEKNVFEPDESLSVYDNFYEYVKSASSFISGTEFSHRQMIVLYNNYTENLVHRDRLDLTYQVLYTCINDIVSSHGKKSSKRKQLKRIQNCLTSKQLIYYFFNQIQYADRQRMQNEYLTSLYKFDFFKKMFESDAYKSIENQIPISIEKLLYKQERVRHIWKWQINAQY